jgi:hypothetical protein
MRNICSLHWTCRRDRRWAEKTFFRETSRNPVLPAPMWEWNSTKCNAEGTIRMKQGWRLDAVKLWLAGAGSVLVHCTTARLKNAKLSWAELNRTRVRVTPVQLLLLLLVRSWGESRGTCASYNLSAGLSGLVMLLWLLWCMYIYM